MNTSPLMRQPEVAEYLHVSEHTLENWRYLRTGPRFTKAGGRVLYRRSDIDDWLDSQAVECDPSAGGP